MSEEPSLARLKRKTILIDGATDGTEQPGQHYWDVTNNEGFILDNVTNARKYYPQFNDVDRVTASVTVTNQEDDILSFTVTNQPAALEILADGAGAGSTNTVTLKVTNGDNTALTSGSFMYWRSDGVDDVTLDSLTYSGAQNTNARVIFSARIAADTTNPIKLRGQMANNDQTTEAQALVIR